MLEKSNSHDRSSVDKKQQNAAKVLRETLAAIEKSDFNSKQRRSAKRKAEAIAAEEAGCSIEELLAIPIKNEIQPSEVEKSEPSSDEKNRRLRAASNLCNSLSAIESDEKLNSKQRRSARKKAEAIAAEEASCSVDGLRSLMKDIPTPNKTLIKTEDGKTKNKSNQNKPIPYVLFVGQLAYRTTKESLFKHFQTELGEDVITPTTLKIRLLTDKKTKKSRGMAFVETNTPELLHSCLELHQTNLDGRRINVHKSFGGGKESRKAKNDDFRKKQREVLDQSLTNVLKDYEGRGDLTEGEFDDNVVELCKKHSVKTVENALKEYVKSKAKGIEIKNPSSYLTFIIGKVSLDRDGMKRMGNSHRDDNHERKRRRTDRF